MVRIHVWVVGERVGVAASHELGEAYRVAVVAVLFAGESGRIAMDSGGDCRL